MTQDRYVLLTAEKNNSGDFLIGHRARNLLKRFRSDRDLVNFDAWLPLDEEQLAVINGSRALLLTGGPALKKKMWPKTYPLVPDLASIKVPVITMGIGWKSKQGDWSDTWDYSLSDKTRQLMQKVEESGYRFSLRDYRSLNACFQQGYKQGLMTGCPALYSPEHLDREAVFNPDIQNITFSLGVSILESLSMTEAMKDLIRALNTYFAGKNFRVAFHHSLNKGNYDLSNPAQSNHIEKHLDFARWLTSEEIPFVELAGSAEGMIEHYANTDLHIGYRVHAHILMAGMHKPTVLISEDGRGKALADVLGGLIFDGYTAIRPATVEEKGWFSSRTAEQDSYVANPQLTADVLNHLDTDIRQGGLRLLHIPTDNITSHLDVMKDFLAQLP